MNYYNEWDKGAAAWLRELIKQGHIPFGVVDERSITEVKPGDLDGFTQCHFFAGIGGWPLALRLAGVSEDTPIWTGSPPCQPFSAAGKQLGQFDPRHLAPVFLDLISECRPPVLFGEQVAPAIAKSWMCDLQTHLEREDYAVGFAVLPACSVGAPHKRERLFFGAHELADAASTRHLRGKSAEVEEGWKQGCQYTGELSPRPCGHPVPDLFHRTSVGFWDDYEDVECADGKRRQIEPGTFPLANGVPARVGRLRGYGNAIVPQVAAEFIKAFMGAVNE